MTTWKPGSWRKDAARTALYPCLCGAVTHGPLNGDVACGRCRRALSLSADSLRAMNKRVNVAQMLAPQKGKNDDSR